LDEAIYLWWTNSEFYYQACSYSTFGRTRVRQWIFAVLVLDWVIRIYSGSRFSEGVMGVRMSIPKTYVALAPTLATLPPRADALKGMAKPLE